MKLAMVPLTIVALLLTASPGLPQAADDTKTLRKDIESLRDQLHKDLEDIKNLLRSRAVAPPAPSPMAPAAAEPDPANVVLNVDSRVPFKGAKGAKLTLVDFTDYQ